MILLLNTFITDTFLSGKSIEPILRNRKHLVKYSSFDVFKYSLSSLSKAYPWKRVILKIKLDENYLNRKEELKQHIDKEFLGFDVIVFWDRNITQSQWAETYDLLNDELIWFNCNHDHIFVDSDQTYLSKIINLMRNDSEELLYACFSHWSENISLLSDDYTSTKVTVYNDYATTNILRIDSIAILSKSVYKQWWCNNKIPDDITFQRPDLGYRSISNFVRCDIQKNFIFFKEICRHFDSYYHLTMNQCPALEIPMGFFDDNIKISYGNSCKLDGYTWINPNINFYKAHDGIGVDFKYTLPNFPLFWKDKIKELKIADNIDDDLINNGKFNDICNMIYSNKEYQNFNNTILQKILTVWFKNDNVIPQL